MTAKITANFQLAYPGFELNVELDLPAQGITALFGPSGSGKSTLLRCFAGLERAQGSFSFQSDIWQDDKHFTPSHQRPIAYVFQEANLFPHLTVQHNLNYAVKRQTETPQLFSLEQIIALLGISHLLNRKPDTLSGGEKQRVAIARALAVNPKLLLMDEPLAALDLARKREILPYLERLHDECKLPVIYVTHSPNEVARLADHLVVIRDGKIQSQGSLNNTFSHLDWPEQNGNNSSVIIEARIGNIQSKWHLAQADFDGGSIWLRDMGFPIGSKVRFQIMARDVSLSLSPEHHSSISNILPVTVDHISNGDHPAIVLARLKLGTNYILSRLTRRSLDSLAIRIGNKVWAQIKSAAIVE